MADLTVKDLRKAVRMLKKNGGKAERLLMSPRMRDKIIPMLNESGIDTKGLDGRHYVFGMEIVTDDRIMGDVAYIDQGDGDDA